MQIEQRKGTAKNYVVLARRLNGKRQKRYIGKASDPVVQLFVEEERLAKANELAHREACCRERDNDIAANISLEWLSEWSTNWKVIRQMGELEMHSQSTAPPKADKKMPGLHKFKEVCRLAESGDVDARAQLDSWIAAQPEILREATDMIAVSREHLLQFVGSASPENVALWRCRLDADTTEILGSAENDPLSRMYAEVVVIAWMDLMRCWIMPSVTGQDEKRSAYWGSAVERAHGRWTKIYQAWTQHLKHTRKLQSNQSSA
ncbi:hypothetical protein [Aporhodopirellula aestuarii]|uniref:Uncharacterized protein n=1 Tax=Aporhodopirellula aestuarii TaxID=2950107 RepID=A0ABT0U4X6_9BACT|nr:hypothetical protein [Aporhodopirellula aestuarii]MCM2371901.1 hypothetical protein [Aporhodopirellula aestuarii]